MSRKSDHQTCCDYECTQGRNCPVRNKLHTHEGGASIDTHTTLGLALERVDTILVGVRFVLLALSMAYLVMVVSYFFG